MGEVYRARDTRLDREVAVKVLPSHLAASPERRERFEREARAISSLSHPNVCTLFDVGHDGGSDYIVMEYLEGETLADRIGRGPLPLEQLVRYGAEIASALEAAHRRGIVHRDLKPGNVVLTRSGAKVLDFGLARVAEEREADALAATATALKPLTEEGTLLGTMPYMAPEQLEGRAADARTDIFALGAVLYEMATGRRAFSGTSRASLIAAIMEQQPPPIASLQPMAPASLERIVRRCLAKDPEERWQSALDVAHELRSVAAEPPPRPQSKKALTMAFALAAFAILAAVVVVVLWRREARTSAVPMYVDVASPPNTQLLGAVISPDAQRIVMACRNEDGSTRLFVRSLHEESARPLEGTEGATFAFWSPDGQHLGFIASGTLKRLPIAGGSVQTIAEADVVTASWGTDGTILFYSANGGLLRVPSRGGTPRPVTVVDRKKGDAYHNWPQFLPDGEHFVFFLRSNNPDRQGAWLGSVSRGPLQRLASSDTAPAYGAGYLLFSERGKLLAQKLDVRRAALTGEPVIVTENVLFSLGSRRLGVAAAGGRALLYQKQDEPPVRQLVWYSRDGKEGEAIGSPAENWHFAVSPDGTRIVLEQIDSVRSAGDLWLLDMRRNVLSRLTSDPDWEWAPVWAPDGRSIAFASTRRDQSDLFELRLGAADWRPLAAIPGSQSPTDFSPDGRFLLYNDGPLQRSIADVVVLDTVTGKSAAVAASSFAENDARFSPDGRWIVFTSNATGRPEIYISPFPATGEKTRISVAGGNSASWSADGREIYYRDPGGTLFAVPVKSAGEAGEPVALFKPPSPQALGRRPYAATRDGRFLVLKELSPRAPGPARLIFNWTATLE
jgi:Tol biopolymer transport system component